MMKSDTFAWDSENECFYYINNVKKMYTKIAKADNEVIYDFLYYVYSSNWNVIGKYLSGYTYVDTIKEISEA